MAKKLLVIDDQTGITKVVELIARQIGLDVRSLNSSAQATETFIAFRPDVLFLDMIMPEKDGIDVLNEILLTGIPVKVVLTSGYSDSYLRLAEGVAKFHDNPNVSVLAQAVPPRGVDEAAERSHRGLSALTRPRRAARVYQTGR
jgi:DNA-binding NtrC family response regulator